MNRGTGCVDCWEQVSSTCFPLPRCSVQPALEKALYEGACSSYLWYHLAVPIAKEEVVLVKREREEVDI